MSEPRLGVVGVGNALVDVLAKVDDAFVVEQHAANGMEKGAMTLVDETRAVELYGLLPGDLMETSGGSAANTLAGFASFGGECGYIAKVAEDELGRIFQQDIRSLGVEFTTQPLIVGAPTGRCMILVTPDAQRTMNTFLGASVELGPEDVDKAMIASAQVTYLEGYLFDKEQAKAAFKTAARLAHDAGHRVALTLSDPFCVDRHRHDFLDLVENHVDILFANEEEIKSLYMQSEFDHAKNAVSKHVEVAALTRGEKGAVVLSGDEVVEIAAEPVAEVVDTTGAGDQFAAGFLYGFTQGMDLNQCGRLGAMAAAEVISHIGPRPHTSLSAFLDKLAA